MFSKSKIVLVAGLVLVLGLPSLAVAQEEPAATSASPTPVTPTSLEITPTNAGVQIADTPNGLQERIESAKNKFNPRISPQRETRIKQSCQSGQAKTTQLSTNVERILSERSLSFSLMSERLNNLVIKLQLAEVDTVKLQDIINEITTLVADIESSSIVYKTHISDASQMDCQSEPAGFLAFIESSREERSNIIEKYSNLKTVFNTKLKPELQLIRNQLNGAITSSEGEQ